jgi:hypothetical protein
LQYLEFHIIKKVEEAEIDFTQAAILVDGQHLIALVREYERPFAEKENAPELAGAYAGLPPETLWQYLKHPGTNTAGVAGKTTILGCTCGIEGCWPLLARIEQQGDKIVWSDFEQPYRGKDSHHHWDYSRFGPFVFDVGQYESALTTLKTDYDRERKRLS